MKIIAKSKKTGEEVKVEIMKDIIITGGREYKDGYAINGEWLDKQEFDEEFEIVEDTKQQQSSDGEWNIEHLAMNIVYQIGDLLYENLPKDVAHNYFVDARQKTNDRAINFAKKLISNKIQKAKEEERDRIISWLKSKDNEIH